MSDYWMHRAERAMEDGDVRKLIFCLGMARDMKRLEHDDEIKEILRRRERRTQPWTGHPPHD